MKQKRILYAVCAACLILCSCGVKKNIPQEVTPLPEQTPAWHTCLIQGARATIVRDGEQLSATVTMQTVRDSLLVISIMPMLGMEMMRVEATPTEITGIDKLHGQYMQATYAELNRQLTPKVNWDILQQLCSAELPTGKEKARLQYSLSDQTIELVVDYPERQLDVPVRARHFPLDKYTKIEVEKFL